MSFALPESMREYIDDRVAAGNYGNTSEYIRDLVRRDRSILDQEPAAERRVGDRLLPFADARRTGERAGARAKSATTATRVAPALR